MRRRLAILLRQVADLLDEPKRVEVYVTDNNMPTSTTAGNDGNYRLTFLPR